jgi:hypothetical protein
MRLSVGLLKPRDWPPAPRLRSESCGRGKQGTSLKRAACEIGTPICVEGRPLESSSFADWPHRDHRYCSLEGCGRVRDRPTHDRNGRGPRVRIDPAQTPSPPRECETHQRLAPYERCSSKASTTDTGDALLASLEKRERPSQRAEAPSTRRGCRPRQAPPRLRCRTGWSRFHRFVFPGKPCRSMTAFARAVLFTNVLPLVPGPALTPKPWLWEESLLVTGLPVLPALRVIPVGGTHGGGDPLARATLRVSV